MVSLSLNGGFYVDSMNHKAHTDTYVLAHRGKGTMGKSSKMLSPTILMPIDRKREKEGAR